MMKPDDVTTVRLSREMTITRRQKHCQGGRGICRWRPLDQIQALRSIADSHLPVA